MTFFEMLEELIGEHNLNCRDEEKVELHLHEIEMKPNSKYDGGHIVRIFFCIGGKELYQFYENGWNFTEIKDHISIKIMSYLFTSFKVCYANIHNNVSTDVTIG